MKKKDVKKELIVTARGWPTSRLKIVSDDVNWKNVFPGNLVQSDEARGVLLKHMDLNGNLAPRPIVAHLHSLKVVESDDDPAS